MTASNIFLETGTGSKILQQVLPSPRICMNLFNATLHTLGRYYYANRVTQQAQWTAPIQPKPATLTKPRAAAAAARPSPAQHAASSPMQHVASASSAVGVETLLCVHN